MLTPFPVEAPHRVRPDLRRLTGPYCVDDEYFESYRGAKREAIARRSPPVLCFERTDTSGLRAALHQAAALIGRGAGAGDTGRDAASEEAAVEAQAHALALSMQEDFVVLRAGPGGAVTELLHVCFPSGWAPEDKLGLSLGEVHAPVADGAALRAAAPALGVAMLTRGPFERYVWTVADSSSLSRHPALTQPAPLASLDDLHFRCERQVLLPLPACGRALFLIRVFVAPLVQVLDAEPQSAAQRRALLLAALRSMSPATIRYKGLQRQIAIVERTLGAGVTDTAGFGVQPAGEGP